MSYTRVKPAGWAFGEKLTSAQANSLDTNLSTALDGATLGLGGTSSTISRICSWAPTLDDSALWNLNAVNAAGGFIETATATTQSCWWPLHIPHGATLAAIRVVIHPAAAHGDLPAEMPAINVRSVTNGGTAAYEVSPVVDSSADVTAYELLHAIEVTGLSLVIDNSSKRYTLFFSAEGSVDGVAGAKVFHPYFDWTMTNLDFE